MTFRRLTLHEILLLVSLLMLLLPLGSLHFLKLYESALIRQTESELISQAAFIGAAYKQEVADALKQHPQPRNYGLALPQADSGEHLKPVLATLDLAKDPVHPRRPDGLKSSQGADIPARQAGAYIIPILQDAQRTTFSGMKVLDYRGIAVAGQQELGLSFIHLPEVQHALKGKHVSLIRERALPGKPPPLSSVSRGANMNIFVAAPILLNHRLIGVALVNRTPMDLPKVLYRKKEDIAAAALAILFLTATIVALTSYAISRPIHALVEQARLLAHGGKQAVQPIAHPVTQEIALLSESLADMARTIEHRSEYIRSFATSVSHEFKTPLTAIQGSVELLQEHWESMQIEQRRRFLNNIAQDTDRLRRLVSRLLELARAETLEPVPVVSSIVPVLAILANRYAERSLQIHMHPTLSHAQLQTTLPVEILETVFVSLWDNSLQHGANESNVRLLPNGLKAFCFEMSDNGPGISEGNSQQIFTPFFTTNRDFGGTGLGLSITRQLLEAYGASIEFTGNHPGATFRLTLPATDSGNKGLNP